MKSFKWFVHGLVAGLLSVATLNALSYFARTQDWASLVSQKQDGQALGFPFEIWRFGKNYGTAMIDSSAMNRNILVALLVGFVVGLICIFNSKWLTDFTDAMIESEKKQMQSTSMQFSLRGLMLMTGASAIIAALFRASIGARPELLWAIYLAGPIFLIALAMIPRSMVWQYRLILLTPSTLILIGFAMFIGNRLGIEFDRVMFGIFVCWVPQTIIAATCLTVGLAFRYNRGKLTMEKG